MDEVVQERLTNDVPIVERRWLQRGMGFGPVGARKDCGYSLSVDAITVCEVSTPRRP